MPKKKKKELNYKKLIKTMIYIIFFMFIIEKSQLKIFNSTP